MAMQRVWNELERETRVWAITVIGCCFLVLAILVIWALG
jgi:hypothetical protein